MVSLWNFMEYLLVNIMLKKCGYILYMLLDYEVFFKYRYIIYVIIKSVNGCVYKWMRIFGGGGMYCYVWLLGDVGMKCFFFFVIIWFIKVIWIFDILVWFYLFCCYWILMFYLYIIFILNLYECENIFVKKKIIWFIKLWCL